MPAVFDPLRRREVFDEFLLRYLLDREKSQFMPAAVGNAAASAVSDILTAWLVGLQEQVLSALSKYREWLEDSIARNERLGDHPAHVASGRSEAFGICRWMMEGINDKLAFRQAVDLLEEAWENEWNDGRESATKEQRIESIDDYLKNCIQGEEYARGARMYETVVGNTRIDPKKIKTAREFGYWLCSAYQNEAPDRECVVMNGERFLKNNLESDWLSHGQALRAAAWLKIVYWHSGAIESPLQCILKAYDLMPHVKRPAFV